MAELTKLSRKDNEEAKAIIERAGVQIIPPPPPDEIKKYESNGRDARLSLVNRLYDRQFLDSIERALEEFRSLQVKTQ